MENIVNSGQKLWERAIKVIPGGNGLLSKRPNRYASELWPVYFSRAKGVNVWDMDGNEYVDMAQMGIGSAILGYSDDDVNNAVRECIGNGINTTLNAPEEVYLAECLLKGDKFAGGVRFARTGGEAMAMAVRIARAFSGKDTVAFSGYHGWTDWYLATNLAGEGNLDEHLLPGLKPKGVPKGLAGTAYPVRYNNVADLEQTVKSRDIGVFVFEGARYDFATKEFIDAIQRLAKEKGIVTVVDEITSGWRMRDGGVYQLYGFEPDIVVYGKAIGNGFAISAILGKKEVMDVSQESFISSTFWTERVGFVAALKTIEKFREKKVWEHLTRIGTLIGDGWDKIARAHGLKLHVTDYKPLITFKFDYGELNESLSTLFIQEMLSRGYLAANSVYVSFSHSQQIVEEYLKQVDQVFAIVAEAARKGDVLKRLKVTVRNDAFKRLT